MFDYNLDNISVQKCYFFNALVRKGSVATAARHLFVPSFKIQNDIKSLEKTLGVPLVLRNQRKLILTEEGKRFADFCRSVVEGLHYLETKKKPAEESLVVAAYYGFSEIFVPEIVEEFYKIHPNVSLKILSGVEYIDFTENDVDVVIASPIYGRSDLVQTHLISTPHNLYASPVYIEKFGVPKSYTEFRHHRLLLFRGLRYIPRQIFDLIDPFIETTSLGLLYELGKKGIGIIPLPKIRLQRDDLSNKIFIPLLTNLDCYDGSLSFITRRVSKKVHLTKSLLEVIKNILENINNK